MKLDEYDNNAMFKMISKEHIVGMTTTGAVKFKSILNKLKSKDVIIEEAAEVIESHIVTSMTQNTEHLILIGDHMQLKPGINDIEIEKTYHLDLSLFERMIKNSFQNVRLKVQRRMRPEISVLVNLFYGDIGDHPSVHGRSNVKNLKHNMFFFDHRWPEKPNEDSSKMNEEETEFIIEFVACLVNCGY